MTAALAVLVAAALEFTVREPPARLHPVAWLGRLVAPVDREWSRPRLAGSLVALGVPLVAAVAVAGTVAAATTVDPLLGVALAGGWLFASTSLGMLVAEARAVAAASATDLSRARANLRSLAGRDATDLSAGQVRSAAVESAAENLADGLVAPLTGFVLAGHVAVAFGGSGALPVALAAAAAAWVKAVNTLDSMLGYRTKPVGWAPARLDDAVMWVPARLTAVLLAAVAATPIALIRARAWVGDVPSPNSGWPMGVLAAALDVRLEKPGVYTLNPDAALPSLQTARAGVRTVGVAGVVAYALAAGTLAIAEGPPWS